MARLLEHEACCVQQATRRLLAARRKKLFPRGHKGWSCPGSRILAERTELSCVQQASKEFGCSALTELKSPPQTFKQAPDTS